MDAALQNRFFIADFKMREPDLFLGLAFVEFLRGEWDFFVRILYFGWV